MSPDDYTSDPNPAGSGVPGTVDDVPADYGEDLPEPTDPVVAGSVPDRTADESRGSSGGDEGELWQHQKVLIDEDEQEGLKLESFPARTYRTSSRRWVTTPRTPWTTHQTARAPRVSGADRIMGASPRARTDTILCR